MTLHLCETSELTVEEIVIRGHKNSLINLTLIVNVPLRQTDTYFVRINNI